jgi:hypothetical protein
MPIISEFAGVFNMRGIRHTPAQIFPKLNTDETLIPQAKTIVYDRCSDMTPLVSSSSYNS